VNKLIVFHDGPEKISNLAGTYSSLATASGGINFFVPTC
jgi:hypothetical protein